MRTVTKQILFYDPHPPPGLYPWTQNISDILLLTNVEYKIDHISNSKNRTKTHIYKNPIQNIAYLLRCPQKINILVG